MRSSLLTNNNKMKYKKLTKELYEKAEIQWETEARALNAPFDATSKKLSFARDALSASNNGQNEECYFVTCDNEDVIYAACSAIISPTALATAKQIRITFSHLLDDSIVNEDADQDNFNAYYDAYLTAIGGHISITSQAHQSKIIKFYGRDQQQLLLLRAIQKTLTEKPNPNIKTCKIAGRWLEICL